MSLDKATIFGIYVTITDTDGVLRKIDQVCENKAPTKPFFVVTAYSESILEAGTNLEFAEAVAKADLVLADGVSVVAAVDYLKRRSKNEGRNLLLGGEIVGKILRGEYANRVTGVTLAKNILESAKTKDRKVYLLGGWNGVAGRLRSKFLDLGSKVKIEWGEEPEIEKINKFAPDVLLVALGRFKQEIWIAQNIGKLRAKVIIGVGSAFDELAGEGMWATPVPEWVNRRGLKWLWRATKDRNHWQRAWRAAVVFPWKVWRS
jgi:N-acetylglucosaminyldiphosphoundecaprenol N-acetyl-beta-D-mannosaminyltransferase